MHKTSNRRQTFQGLNLNLLNDQARETLLPLLEGGNRLGARTSSLLASQEKTSKEPIKQEEVKPHKNRKANSEITLERTELQSTKLVI